MWKRKAAGVLTLLVFLGVLVQTSRTDNIHMAHWPKELHSAAGGKEAALAVIYADAAGAALSWEYPDNREDLPDRYLLQKAAVAGKTENGKVPWLFMKLKLEDLKGTDIWNWLLQNRDEGYLYHIVTDAEEEGYYFVLNWEGAEKQGMVCPKQILIIKDGFCWMLECCGITEENRRTAAGLISDFEYSLLPHSQVWWRKDEEWLYWTDHDRRETRKQAPRREFVEIRTVYRRRPGQAASYHILMTEAHYHVQPASGTPEMDISFYFRGNLSAEGKETCLLDYGRTAPYRMEIRTAEDGKLIQEGEVELVRQRTDPVFFVDLDEDGFLRRDLSRGVSANELFVKIFLSH